MEVVPQQGHVVFQRHHELDLAVMRAFQLLQPGVQLLLDTVTCPEALSELLVLDL